ncbi:hypothetical protein PC9H_009582 [Pleurotus ostreatus]|uniref:SAM-dependent MTase RsmB/NOP-type domain-containing protein n=2 Tax=Pleurotus TaxID=5320 RepID=A0A8H6ZQZ6_PLEOS|nr:uncharacterized protein PC9H_009582 [Pleurotus ostreatus]KAF7424276.1 hypothetical protein PC9H_009582 [Pleurotus ostreatus]KAJ8692835.1 hypothetical protein PTI98_010110 [Pleurotus ostreatus]
MYCLSMLARGHMLKVPFCVYSTKSMNFYLEAAKVLDSLDARKGSIKGLLGTVVTKDRKRTAALVIETLKFKSVITEVISQAKLLKEENKKIKSPNLALLLVHDLLLAKGIQAGDGPIKQAILRHRTRLNAELQKIKIKRGVKDAKDLAVSGDPRAEQIPRYARVNTLLWNSSDAIEYFVARGFVLSGPFESDTGFGRDAHVPNLLQFAPRTLFHEDDAYLSGKIILQDKASCFPAIVLNPPSTETATVIDATSAPGNKTSHLSALMGGKGTLYAFERDFKRFSTLKHMLSSARCQNVQPVNADFLTVDPSDTRFAGATHILLDPSCSGSGIVNRLDYLVDTDSENEVETNDRLNKLAAFQLSMIKHAMKFPAVQRIVYSTCSIHALENEHVVKEALASDEAVSNNFQLAPKEDVLPTWPRRGLPSEMNAPESAESLIRCSPGEDGTNGFFVSCFVKRTKDPMKKRKNPSSEDPPRKKKHKQKR